MPLHAQRERLDSAQGEERIEGTRHAAHRVLQVGDALLESLVVPHDRSSADGIGVPVQVLRGRVHHDVEAVLERTLDEGRRKGVVAHREQPVLAGDARHGPQVHQLQQRVGGCLHPQQARVRADGRLEGLGTGEVHERDAVTGRALAHVLEQPVAAPVQIVHGDDVRARIQKLEQRGARGHAGGKREPCGTAFEVRHRRLQRVARGVARARVLVALVHAGTGLHVSGGRIDRRHHRSGQRVGVLAAMDDAGGEALPGTVVAHSNLPLTACGAAS